MGRTKTGSFKDHKIKKFMREICVDIVVPKTYETPGICFKRQVLESQGQLYPQDLVQAKYEYFNLTQGPLAKFVLPKIPKHFEEQSWQCISVVPDDDQISAALLKPADIYADDSIFFELIQQITGEAKEWIIIFTANCDEPEEVLPGNLKTAFQKISDSLKNNGGFIMYHNSTSATV
ncbi:hypothetical protein [Niabella hibiscisoli]|uniref:hypothetical protein n=1 Tax=Niabella hibiscisoli TaxID=1825928 RepID=UPI001F0F5383|nr:hypothetical protein [Niabella hibiscisoli]MCH5719577.1 hypothetical protein [Niabella hibiscisoli]